MDHCGDHICGNPQILKFLISKYFISENSKMIIYKSKYTN